MYKAHTEYPQTREFLEHATTHCGKPFALHGEKHETLGAGADLTFDVVEPGRVYDDSAKLTVTVSIGAVTMRGQGVHRLVEEDGETVAKFIEDRLVEGIVMSSWAKSFRPGDSIIALASLGCDALVVNTASQQDMGHSLATFNPGFRHHLV